LVNTDGLPKIQLIFGLAEFTRKLENAANLKKTNRIQGWFWAEQNSVVKIG